MLLPLPEELRHAYRALLRAATYLPDSAARAYIHNYVMDRFRSTSVNIRMRFKHEERYNALVERYHGTQNVRKARQFAHKLERAGQGNMADLKKILFMTYGRLGPRRRQLIAELLKPEEETLPDDDEALARLIEGSRTEPQLRFTRGAKVSSFLKSQVANPSVMPIQLPIKGLTVKIPAETIWGRPVPRKLEFTKKKEHWAQTLNRVSPPVPGREWERLRDLATGAVPIEDPVPRRKRREQPADANLEMFQYLIGSKDKMKELGKETESNAPREIPKRSMRRLYAKIWSATSILEKDAATQNWVTQWGSSMSASQSGRISAPDPAFSYFFESAGEAAQPRQKKLTRRQSRERSKDKTYSNIRRPLQVLKSLPGYTQGVQPPEIWGQVPPT